MKGRKRRSSDRYSVFEGGEKIPAPDYAQFRAVCEEVGAELGMSGAEVYRIYKSFINCSVELLFPEGSPRALDDSRLLESSRRIQLPRIASLAVTERSLRRWRAIEERIRAKRGL